LIDAPQVKQKWNFGADLAVGARNSPWRNIPWNLTAKKGN
jgi:hypothetical protein